MYPRNAPLPELLTEGGLIVAGHPDDEVIGAAGLLQRFAGWSVLHLTDGAPRDQRFWAPVPLGSRDEYAALREREALAALALADVAPSRVHGLGLPDQEAACALPRAARELARRIAETRPPVVLVQPYEGGHPDHDAGAFAAHAALGLLARERVPDLPPLIEMTAYHRGGGALVTGRFLPRDDAPEVSVPLAPAGAQRKAEMLARHASQRQVLAAFDPGADERFRAAPRYDFGAPPHPGALNYELLGFELTGERWRALARAAAAELGLSDALCP